MHKRMKDFIIKLNILNFNQFGFIRDHKTSDALFVFLDNAYEVMNKNKVFLTIFLGFSKAFDTVGQEIVLYKLQSYGFRGKRLQWLSSFLSDRTHCIDLGNKRYFLREN